MQPNRRTAYHMKGISNQGKRMGDIADDYFYEEEDDVHGNKNLDPVFFRQSHNDDRAVCIRKAEEWSRLPHGHEMRFD